MRFRIVIAHPPGWQHAGMYRELAETLVHGFTRLGHHADIAFNAFEPTATNVLMHAHELAEEHVRGPVRPLVELAVGHRRPAAVGPERDEGDLAGLVLRVPAELVAERRAAERGPLVRREVPLGHPAAPNIGAPKVSAWTMSSAGLRVSLLGKPFAG